ncbi:hypothetical protein AB5V95_00835 [Metamycoplasma spumans]|uniref:hypothetical protein n=1 Tax=Metamycoplasma spumans TaxID=92406 RepID=UPI0034DCC823
MTKKINLCLLALSSISIPTMAAISCAKNEPINKGYYDNGEEILDGGMYNRKYLKNYLLYSKLRYKNNNQVIDKPFRLLTFKTSNKEQEIIDFVKENSISNHFMIAIKFEIEIKNKSSELDINKEFKKWLESAKEMMFLYLPNKIKIVKPDQFVDIHDFFESPIKEVPEFKIPASNTHFFFDNEVKFIDPLYFKTWREVTVKHQLLRIYRKNNIKYKKDKNVDVIDTFSISLQHYKQEAVASLVLERLYPNYDYKDEKYIEEYEIDVNRLTLKYPIFMLDY